MSPYPSMTLFDAPSRERSCVRRSRTNTPLQALVLLNDPAFVEMADALAERITQHADSFDKRLHHAFQLVLGRFPDAEETARFREFADGHATDGTLEEAATWRLLAQVLLNLDETITKE